ncbi:MAG: helix-turn-helix transcriptional regulator [Dehalococcoidia bacterium]
MTAVGRLTEVSDAAGFPDAAIVAADTVVPSDVTTFNDVDIEHASMTVRTRPADFVYPAGVEALFAQHADEHPLIHYFNETGDGSAWKISDFLGADAFHESLLYRSVYGPIGVEDQMSITLPSSSRRVIGLVVNRGQRDFSEDDRAALNLVRPYLAQTYRLLQERDVLTRLARSAGAVIESTELAAISLGDHAAEITPGSLVLLYRYFGRPGAESELPERIDSWLRRERAKANAGVEQQPGAGLLAPIVARRGSRQLVVRFVPGRDASDALVLRVLDDAEPAVVQLESLRLTAREAQIARLLMGGSTNAEIGRALQITPGTVKKHLDHVYRKVGASNRVTAVKAILELHASAGLSF